MAVARFYLGSFDEFYLGMETETLTTYPGDIRFGSGLAQKHTKRKLGFEQSGF